MIVALVTCGSEEEADKISELLIRERVAACVNVADVQSFFEWKAKREKQPEKLMIIKSVNSRFNDLERLIKAHHSYECPEIIAFEIKAASKDYAEWVREACSRIKA